MTGLLLKLGIGLLKMVVKAIPSDEQRLTRQKIRAEFLDTKWEYKEAKKQEKLDDFVEKHKDMEEFKKLFWNDKGRKVGWRKAYEIFISSSKVKQKEILLEMEVRADDLANGIIE